MTWTKMTGAILDQQTKAYREQQLDPFSTTSISSVKFPAEMGSSHVYPLLMIIIPLYSTTVLSRKDSLRSVTRASKSTKKSKSNTSKSSKVLDNSLEDDVQNTAASPPTSSPLVNLGDMIQLDATADETVHTPVESITIQKEENVRSGGVCSSDGDCHPRTRQSAPGDDVEIIGVNVCECYANSWVDSFAECQGSVNCVKTFCESNKCAGAEAYCSESGFCELLVEEVILPGEDVAVDTINVPSFCTSDSECPDGYICRDESNNRCFYPPCGRCFEALTLREMETSRKVSYEPL